MLARLKYIGYAIVFAEVPDEVSLAINISGCRRRCRGCHSKYLWEYSGNYVSDDLDSLINKYNGMITCVCFMGGDQNMTELCELLKKVKAHTLKTCVYSGSDDINEFSECLNNDLLDYLKIGSYDDKLGGLDKETTNQKMFAVNSGGVLQNITHKMRRKIE